MFRTLLASLALLLSGCAPTEETGPVVLAASSLTEAIEAAADAWEAQGHLRPVLSFAGSASVARQVEQGAPADIVITADEQWMDWLAEHDLVDADSRRDIASNSLVFVRRDQQVALPTGSGWQPRRIAMADPDSVPAGRYARSALEHAGAWQAVEAMVVPAENVRQALALVERGEAELGVVYATDARTVPGLVTDALPLPEGVEVLYPAAILASSTSQDAGAFLEFLSSREGGAILCEHGFSMPGGRTPC
ncbi:molybdate ABC transporter substrate-binding protein [Aurantiacibacter gilvus]|uniref:Molybdate ABC transporter substrate-binding protein n=1 Tax=Aurantiacibacter gilvus TaxID=3139141 RepID=A0ABU9IB19_9SPHN